MRFEYIPKGVCSRKMVFEMEGDVVTNLVVTGGCAGNLLGISRLIRGMHIAEIVEDFKGVRCGLKRTSCPDQIAEALLAYEAQYLK